MYKPLDHQVGYPVPTQRASRTITTEHRRASTPQTSSTPVDEDALYTTRTSTSARCYKPTVPTKVVVHDLRKKQPSLNTPQSFIARTHWIVVAGGSMLLTVILVSVGGAIGNAWNSYQDNLNYGMPRTYQTDASVGHGPTPSHFIALNLHSHIEVIELPGDNASNAKIYDGSTLTGYHTDSIPVTLVFKDVNHDGKLDMVVQTSTEQYPMINDNGQFRPLKPGERIDG